MKSFQATISQLEAKLKQKTTGNSSTGKINDNKPPRDQHLEDDRTKDKTNEPKKKSWKNIPPKQGEQKTQEKNGRTWNFRKYHQYWTANHDKNLCAYNPKNKERNEEAKTTVVDDDGDIFLFQAQLVLFDLNTITNLSSDNYENMFCEMKKNNKNNNLKIIVALFMLRIITRANS